LNWKLSNNFYIFNCKGNTDIINGNLKLILGLVWHLILRYQIGKTKIPPKKLILAWLKAILPDCEINNLTSDLNNGIILGLLNIYLITIIFIKKFLF
jgi:filamin